MKIIVENSTWNNVGDGWYQFSLYFMLKECLPQHEVILGEGPIKRAFRITSSKQMKNALNWMDYQAGDIHVFSGPLIPTIDTEYKHTIQEIKKRKKDYVLISASGTGLSKSRVTEIGNFFKKYPPLFFSSRDEESFNNFSPYIKNSYNGICTACLVDTNIDIQSYKMEEPFFISSFYTELEPSYSLQNNDDVCNIENLQIEHHKTKFYLPFKIARHLNFMQPQQAYIGNLKIVRTIQNLNTRFNHINFAMPNSFISFNPLSYLEITKSSQFVISDRVHACAIALACNKPARFLFNTPRAGIFDRMGFDYKSNNGIMYPNIRKIKEERQLLIKQIIQHIG